MHAPHRAGKLVVDARKLRPVARLGGYVYGQTNLLYEIPRPNKDGSYPEGHQPRLA